MIINGKLALPETARRYILSIWQGVYEKKTLSRERGWALVEGVIYGTLFSAMESDYPEAFTGEDAAEAYDFYRAWFSL